MTIRDARKKAFTILKNTPQPYRPQTPLLDIDCFLMLLLQKDKAFLLSHDDALLTAEQLSLFENMITERSTGRPVAYIVNRKEFWGLDFYVDESVLIPKSDTEILVEEAVCCSKKILENTSHAGILDLCCGSGCVGIALLHSLTKEFHAAGLAAGPEKTVRITASDISRDALDVAKKNYQSLIYPDTANTLANAFSETDLIQSDVYVSDYFMNKKFDLIVSNPPYVPSSLTQELLKDGRREPVLALDGGNEGLDVIERIIQKAPSYLKQNGVILLETGEYNAVQTAQLLKESGFSSIEHVKDLSGADRVVKARFKSA